MLNIHPHTAPTRGTNNEGRYFHLPYFISRGCINWYMFQKLGFKSTPILLPYLTMHLWVEDAMYIYQEGIPMYGGDV